VFQKCLCLHHQSRSRHFPVPSKTSVTAVGAMFVTPFIPRQANLQFFKYSLTIFVFDSRLLLYNSPSDYGSCYHTVYSVHCHHWQFAYFTKSQSLSRVSVRYFIYVGSCEPVLSLQHCSIPRAACNTSETFLAFPFMMSVSSYPRR
jgi:hypothetical protein